MSDLPIESFRLQNFKAVRDSGEVKFTPLTVFIGNNGSGKSSLIEGLEILHLIVTEGLDRAMQHWRGFEHIWNQSVLLEQKNFDEPQEEQPGIIETEDEIIEPDQLSTLPQEKEPPYLSKPMAFSLQTLWNKQTFNAEIQITMTPSGDRVFIKRERIEERGAVRSGPVITERDAENKVTTKFADGDIVPDTALDDYLQLTEKLEELIANWQFLSLNPQAMGSPILQKRTGGKVKLEKDGSNIAEYLLSIRNLDINAFNGIVETLHYVLPYTADIQPSLTSELERNVYLQLNEGQSKLPGWLLSTGTLRILAILAVLRHPDPPPVLVIDEIENGLDPSTIHLVTNEIRRVVENSIVQVIITTHSPFFLNLLDLSQIVLVERNEGIPVFTRPGDNAELQVWSRRFAPGDLYTRGHLSIQPE